MPISDSPRATGRGGAEIGVADDAYAVATNPAGLSFLQGDRIELGLELYLPQVTFTNSLNQGTVDQGLPIPAPAVGFTHTFGTPDEPEPTDPPPLAFGLLLAPVAGGGGSAMFHTPLFPEGEKESSKLLVYGLTAGFSVRVLPRVSLGLAVVGLYASLDQAGLGGGTGGQTQGLVRNFNNGQLDTADPDFLINGQTQRWSDVFQAASAPNSYSSSRVVLRHATGLGVSAVLGVLFQATDEVSLGASYRAPGVFGPLDGQAFLDASRATEAGSASLDAIQTSFLQRHLPDGGSFLGSSYSARLTGFRMPEIAGVGAAVRPHPQVLLALDLKWIDWASAFDEVKVALRGGESRDLNEITSNQTSSTVRSTALYHWRSQGVVAVGGAFAATEWLCFRAGYNYGNNPVPTKTESPFNSATTEHHLTAGIGVRVGPVSIDAAYVHAFVHASTIEGSAVKTDFDGTRHKADQDAFLLGGSYEF
jgi:long-subunit fatty acid transport protein